MDILAAQARSSKIMLMIFTPSGISILLIWPVNVMLMNGSQGLALLKKIVMMSFQIPHPIITNQVSSYLLINL